MKLSAVITAYNEEKNIASCIQSVHRFADEVIVVDNSSTDKTQAIAKKWTKKVYIQKNNPQAIDTQKNFGFEKATGDWILSLDADETVTQELVGEIKKVLEESPAIDGYFIPRKNIIFGKWIKHTGYYPDFQLRLFKKGKGKFTKEHVHEDMTIDGKTAYLTGVIEHQNYQSVAQFIQRNLLIYAPNEAAAIKNKGYIFSYLDAIRFPAREFLSRYFAREGYKDGLHGLVLSLLLSSYHLAIFCYIWEQRKFPEEQDLFSEKHIQQESDKLEKEFSYWVRHEDMQNETNPFKKVLLKTKHSLLK